MKIFSPADEMWEGGTWLYQTCCASFLCVCEGFGLWISFFLSCSWRIAFKPDFNFKMCPSSRRTHAWLLHCWVVISHALFVLRGATSSFCVATAIQALCLSSFRTHAWVMPLLSYYFAEALSPPNAGWRGAPVGHFFAHHVLAFNRYVSRIVCVTRNLRISPPSTQGGVHLCMDTWASTPWKA